MPMKNNYTVKQCRDYMTRLLMRRSIIALCAGLLTIILSFYGIIAGIDKTVGVIGKNAFVSFIYFTMISNTIAALSATFTIPFAIEGIRKKRFTLPGWIAIMHYCSAVSLTIVMILVVGIMSWVSPEDAFGDFNIILHIFCPILILISFFQTESGHIYTLKEQLIGTAPFVIYMTVYLVEVIVIGEVNGGWRDIYYVKEFPYYGLSAVVLLVSVFGVGYAIRIIANRLTRVRTNKMFSFWTDGVDPLELGIEAYGLGVMTGKNSDKSNVRISYDILEYLAEKYRLDIDTLAKPFMKGLANGFNEKESKTK